MTSRQSLPLTCEIALQRLDAVAVDLLPTKPLEADLAAAWEHARECSTCWSTVESRRTLDQRISNAMSDVRVPAGLRDKLLAVVADTTCRSDSKPLGARSLQRRVVSVIVSSALLMLIAIGSAWWLRPTTVSLQTLRDQTPMEPGTLEIVSDFSKFPPLPASWRSLKSLTAWDKLRAWPLNDQRSEGLWIPFEVKLAKQTIRGVLLATSKANVFDPPAELIVSATRLGYTTREGRPIAVAGWTEHGVVYLCFVPGEAASLEKLLRATAPTAA